MTREHGPAITSKHLSRDAVVYVRQSSPEQVRDNSESTRLQLQLRRIKAAKTIAQRDTMTMNEVQAHLGIGHNGVLGLVRLGAITTNQVTDFAPWRVSREDVDSERVQGLVRFLKETGRLPRGGSPQAQPGLFDDDKGLTPEVKKGAL